MKVVISSGHGAKCPGAVDILDEHKEAVRVVNKVAEYLRAAGVDVVTYEDTVSTNQDDNLERIVNFHNAQGPHEIDCFVHFNCNTHTSKPVGTECWWMTQDELARDVATAIADGGDLIDRGPKFSDGLYVLKHSVAPAILPEICFVDSEADCNLYRQNFDLICNGLAEAIAGKSIVPGPSPPGPMPPEPPLKHPQLSIGSTGPAVYHLQEVLAVPADGDFGEITEAQVDGFQRACGLSADGIVGPNTWVDVDELERKMREEKERLSDEMIEQIVATAKDSDIQDYEWPDRGMSPPGYVPGICLCYATASLDLSSRDYAKAMGDTLGSTSSDALAWYKSELTAQGCKFDSAQDRLRSLFVLMTGLAMRESSGRYPEGRDMSATNIEATTAEAALWQASWNISSADATIPGLMQDYWKNPHGFLDTFRENVDPTSENLDTYGTGDGAKYQWLAKFSPCFAAMVAGVGLRNRKDHWGPVKRKEVTIRREAETLLREVDRLIASQNA